ncbi:MarR family winged helix-turn-helix transcriptional regulator [Actinophytocola sp.]|uniref:MarR family winged helix-turn-helix transcriptional regulator n=1 Tax=Actinophytocola sp. TaxID=1872138 RepID=UPI002ED3FB67
MDGTRWLTEREQQVWRRFVGVLTWVPTELEAQLQRDADLTHFGYWVLAMLSERPGRAVRMSDLAAMVDSSQSRLSHVVGKLERQGWVRRERATEDGRGNVAVLTDVGLDKLRASAPGHVAAVRALVFDVLTPAQLEALDGICDAILTKVRATH